MRSSDGETGMRVLRFSMGAAILSIVAWSIYVTVFLVQLGVPTTAEYWLHDAQVVKDYLLKTQTENKKVLIVGGSSVWFGIDAGELEKTLGVTSINLGLHAMLPLDRLIKQVGPALRRGDTVIMPLEYEYYTFDTPYTDWYVNQIMAEDAASFWNLNGFEKVRFVIAVPPTRVLEGLLTKIFSDRLNMVRRRQSRQNPEEVVAIMRRNWKQNTMPEDAYSFQNIDSHGDAIMSRGSFGTDSHSLKGSLAQSYPWNTLHAFAGYCVDRQVHLMIGWPPMVKGMVDFDSRRVKQNVQVIRQNLSQLGIPILGLPSEFQYDRRLFSDSAYHLTHEGRTLHTQHMLRLITAQADS